MLLAVVEFGHKLAEKEGHVHTLPAIVTKSVIDVPVLSGYPDPLALALGLGNDAVPSVFKTNALERGVEFCVS